MKKILFIFLFIVSLSYSAEKPKNIIVLVGDGMGLNYVSASLIKWQNNPFYKFLDIGIALTSSLDRLITDSAAGGTAIATGEKTNNGYIAQLPEGENLKTLIQLAEERGYKTGVVVTSSLTNATPASFLANVDSRKKDLEIAFHIVNSGIDIAIGSGKKYLLNENQGGKQTSDINLVDTLERRGYKVFLEYDDFKNNSSKYDKVFSIFGEEGLPKANERNYTLKELVKYAISKLNNKDGFVLMVEGSQIDWAAHNHDQDYVMGELEDFLGAIDESLSFQKENRETLVLVTADHETGGMAITKGSLDGSEFTMSFTTKGHTPEAVGVFAKGPGSELFRGVYHLMNVGKNLKSLIREKNAN